MLKYVKNNGLAFMAIGVLSFAPSQLNATVMTQSIVALVGVKSAIDSRHTVYLVKNWYPNASETKIRVAYATVLASVMAGANLLGQAYLNPKAPRDYEAAVYMVGEYLLGFTVGHLYFSQPVIPGARI